MSQHKKGLVQRNFSEGGFTLIELLVVIAIIGILVAVVFVALDPATRFQQARDAVRQNDVQEILSAILLEQIDDSGNLHANLAASAVDETNGDVYMIVNGSGMADGCDDSNSACTTNVSGDTHCVDVATIVTEGYFGTFPVSPAGAVAWDDSDADGDLGSGYTYSLNSVGVITIRSCEDEQITEISAAR